MVLITVENIDMLTLRKIVESGSLVGFWGHLVYISNCKNPQGNEELVFKLVISKFENKGYLFSFYSRWHKMKKSWEQD